LSGKNDGQNKGPVTMGWLTGLDNGDLAWILHIFVTFGKIFSPMNARLA
jgi:hypothetical protein